ncbi:type I-E CRISPR-associated protein Cas7/Cse4/CasC [Rubrivirga sp.]|uniref:type I-E CRISPR-associated protein Cas7/Cse4/CasC n=1 Tax=Rubrivirga sp. TaxID=1885344 RepID=UPI003C721357
MKVEVHLLQSFPPANLNRDDTGQPKDCEFGGVRRGRISSQALKRRMRTSGVFEREFGDKLGKRTKRAHQELAPRLVDLGHDLEVAESLAQAVLAEMMGWDEAKSTTSVLWFVGFDELDRLAALTHEHAADLEAAIGERSASPDLEDKPSKADKKKRDAADKGVSDAAKVVSDAFKKGSSGTVRSVDVALFGRMLANLPGTNIDAAAQVAHAISTHAVDQDFDYYTAVDDLNSSEQTGAGMVGTTGFNASCYYRYALVDAEQLATNLAEGETPSAADRHLAADAVEAFLEAAYTAIPTGKQNAFAAQTPPSLVMAVARGADGMPWSLANAFVDPVRANGRGLVAESVARLGEHWDALVDMYGLEDGGRGFVKVAKDVGETGPTGDGLEAAANARAVVEGVGAALRAWADASDTETPA